MLVFGGSNDMDAVYCTDEFGITAWPLLHSKKVNKLSFQSVLISII